MTRRVEHRDDIRSLDSIKDAGKFAYRTAAATFDDLYTRGYAASEAGRAAARAAADRMYGKYWPTDPASSEGMEGWKVFPVESWKERW